MLPPSKGKQIFTLKDIAFIRGWSYTKTVQYMHKHSIKLEKAGRYHVMTREQVKLFMEDHMKDIWDTDI